MSPEQREHQPDGTGLSIGATALAAVVVDRAAVRRTPVLTLYPHRPPEVGVPSENPRLDERGLVITDFVDRVGDPVGILAADGSSHRGETLTADALRALLYALNRGREPVTPIAVTHPAHWHAGAVEALRAALADIPEFGPATPLLSDAVAALTALQAEPGLPTRGLIALCDFGGTGTSITVVDAANGYEPIAPTVRHLELSGDLVDQALLSHVIADLPGESLSGTSAIGSLTRLRGECRGAKERLSTETVTALTADLPGHSGEIRLTRTELDDAMRGPLGEFVAVLHDTIERSGARSSDLAAVATVGGAARTPIVTTALSENFRVPVITTARPELSAAIGAGLTAVRGPDDDRTALAAAVPAGVAGAAALEEAAPSSTFRALAWSDADDIPDIAPAAYDEPPAPGEPRPQLVFGASDPGGVDGPAALPWYRRTPVVLALGAAVVLAALAAAVYLVNRDDDAPASTVTTTAPTPSEATTAVPPPVEPPAAPPAEAPAPAAPPPAEAPAPQNPAPETVSPSAPPPAPSEAPPPPPPPTTQAPPPTTQAPPPTTEPPRLIPTLPYTTIPGLPFVPAPPGFGG